MKNKKIVVTAILIIVIINIFSVFNPILLLNLKNAKKICNDYNIIEVKLNSDNEYVSREEFLDSVLYAIGMNVDIIILILVQYQQMILIYQINNIQQQIIFTQYVLLLKI